MQYDVIIVGAGPGGLACAQLTAAHGLSTLVLERNREIGKKVCAGGITWNGLIQLIDSDIAEKQFRTQCIYTQHQKVRLSSLDPIIATVNRSRLGKYMAAKAEMSGATIYTGCRVLSLNQNSLEYIESSTGQTKNVRFNKIIGADGSSSLVRRSLGVKTEALGIGINYQLPLLYDEMQWHLNTKLFKSGYAWIFPHKSTVSVGGYVDARVMTAKQLKDNLSTWGSNSGLNLSRERAQAEFINFDYRGYCFGNRYLIGDAAGLASGLTGEGIYPAIISGQEIAKEICGIQSFSVIMKKMIKKHKMHRTMVSLAGKNMFIAKLLTETITYALYKGLIDFSAAEMAP